MNNKVSVIVPIYKVEKYLDKCVESIVNQTYSNLEIILVDDGSPDNCPKMCDDWAKKDSRIRVIHKENGGLSDARNAGTKVATGEYIAFVDSDDFLDIHYVEWLYNAIVDHNVNMSACDLSMYYDGDVITINSDIGKITVETSEEAIRDIQGNCRVRAVAWNKMYHKDLLKGEEYPVGKYHEDEFFTYRIIHKAQKLAYIDSKLYYYRQREGSIMASFNIRHLDSLESGLQRLELLEKEYPKLYIKDKAIFCTGCVQLYRAVLKSNLDDKKGIKKVIINSRKKVKVSFSELKNYNTKTKVYTFAGRYFIGVFSKLLNTFEGNKLWEN